MMGFILSPIGRKLALGAALVAVGLYLDRSGYNRGYADARATQVAADAETYQKIIQEMQDAGIDVSNPDAVDCELQRLSGEPVSEKCSSL